LGCAGEYLQVDVARMSHQGFEQARGVDHREQHASDVGLPGFHRGRNNRRAVDGQIEFESRADIGRRGIEWRGTQVEADFAAVGGKQHRRAPVGVVTDVVPE
jgi:hypothetical protein